ncbi:MAG: hypothetical protein WD557_13925 [Dehalococcoidia bacterium]
MAVIDASVLVARFLLTDANHLSAVNWLRALAAAASLFTHQR